MARLTRKRFREWLGAKEPSAVVAHQWDESTCPIAIWLHEDLGYRAPACCVGGSLTGNDEYLGKPRWAGRFADDVDKEYGRSTRSVIARQCLELL